MSVPNIFAALIGPIPLSYLDNNFAAVELDIVNAQLAISNGSYPLTTPNIGNATGTSLILSNGIYTSGAFTATGSYSDGIVMDYVTSNGRFSVGVADGFTWYNGGVATTPLMYLAPTGNLWQNAPAPTSIAVANTLTAAQIQSGIINTTGTTYTLTLPTGTALDTAVTGISATNLGFDFYIINTASGTITIAVGASGMTSLGSLTVATGTSAQFKLRRTAANTYVLYRLG